MQDLTEKRNLKYILWVIGEKKILPKVEKEGVEVSCHLLAGTGLQLHVCPSMLFNLTAVQQKQQRILPGHSRAMRGTKLALTIVRRMKWVPFCAGNC